MIFSKILYVTYGKVVRYDPQLHKLKVCKMLAWHNLIIVGPQKGHAMLLYCYKLATDYKLDTSLLIAAGNVNDQGIIYKWASLGFSFTTPNSIRPHILKALCMIDVSNSYLENK